MMARPKKPLGPTALVPLYNNVAELRQFRGAMDPHALSQAECHGKDVCHEGNAYMATEG
jgi:hypothetical protein